MTTDRTGWLGLLHATCALLW